MQLERISIQINGEKIIPCLDLSIQPGEIFVLMGPSGSGKTSLLKGIAGLLPFASGNQTWENGEGTTGFVFQEPRLFPHLTVLENIAFGLRVKGMSAKERRARAFDFLKNLQLDNLENRYPHQLSGGQQQRVSLGRALILNPDLLLLDEPFASLDTPLRQDLTEWLYHLQRRLGFSILWVTHYIEEALAVADRIGVMLEGTLQQIGSPADLFQKPASEKVAQFLSLSNRFSREQWCRWFGKEPTAPRALTRGWVDPNHLQLMNGEVPIVDHDEQACLISGVVSKIKPSREGFLITISADNQSLDVNMIGWQSVPKLNEMVKIRIPYQQIHWYPE